MYRSKEQKLAEANARAEKWRALTPQEKWNVLNKRLGNGLGAKKERAKLIAECLELVPVSAPAPKVADMMAGIPPKKKINIKQGRVILK